jgi:phage baseplate assembly protein W
MTEPGERVMMPQYGVGLRRMFFEQGDTILYEEARRRMLNAINQWEPRIVVRALTVSAPKEDDPRLINFDGRDNSLIISIEYSLKDDLDNIDSLVFRTNFNTSKLL